MDRDRMRWEIGMGGVAIVMAAAFLFDGRKLAPGVFEPIGPGPVPKAIAWLIIALSGAMMAPAIRHLARGTASAPAPLAYAPRPVAAALVFAATAVYVAAMGMGWVGFAPATIVYLTATIWSLAEFRPIALGIGVVVSTILGFGLRYLFTRVLVTDLP